MTTTDRELLIQAGQALYGTIWQSELARALGISDRSVRAWLAETRSIPPGIWAEMAQLIQQRRDGLQEVAALVQRRARALD